MLKHLFIAFRPTDGGGDGAGLTAEQQAAADTAAGERPAWLPENFKTPEDFAKSYGDLRVEADRQREENAKLSRDFTQALENLTTEAEQRQQRVDPGSDPLIAAFDEAVQTGDARSQLAIQLELQRRMLDETLTKRESQVTPQIEAMQAAQRQTQIDMAEEQIRGEATAVGLDYDASRNDIVEALKSLYGPSLLPATGDVPTYAAAMRNAVNIVHSQALIAQVQSGELLRREKLSSMATTPGASGRVAQGSTDEQEAWKEVKGAETGSYSELMARASRG